MKTPEQILKDKGLWDWIHLNEDDPVDSQFIPKIREAFIEALEEFGQQFDQPWISVNDSLPIQLEGQDYSDEVLCICLRKFDSVKFVLRYDHTEKMWLREHDVDARIWPITHWMPIKEDPII